MQVGTGLNMERLTSFLDFDISDMKLPGFFGELMKAQVSNAVLF